jgi:hypothetical protein
VAQRKARGVDGSDRDARDPVGIDAALGQGFERASLAGPERAATLERKCDVLERKMVFGRHEMRSGLQVNCNSPYCPGTSASHRERGAVEQEFCKAVVLSRPE